MVLQNKYKARASRRYNSTNVSTSQQGGEQSTKPGFRQRHFRRFAGVGGQRGSQDGEADSGDDNEEGTDEDEDEKDDEGEAGDKNGDGVYDPRFPSLQQAAQSSQPKQQKHATTDGGPTSFSSRGQYSRRKLGESNAARILRLESEKDPHLEESEEEPEIDISALVARVKALDSGAQTQAGISADIVAHRADRETASDVEKDIDHSLAWLHDKEMQRRKDKGQGGWSDGQTDTKRNDSHAKMRDVDADGNKIDYEQIKREKEKAEALRALKARFQGRALGDRESKSARSRPVPSIQIGPHKDQHIGSRTATERAAKGSSSLAADLFSRPSINPISPADSSSSSSLGGSSGTGLATSSASVPPANDSGGGRGVTSAVSASVAAEIDVSLRRQRKLAQSGTNDSSSVSSQWSSFSTDFGRRRSPMSIKDYDATKGACPPTDEIDSFLNSLKPEMAARVLQQPQHVKARSTRGKRANGDHGDRASAQAQTGTIPLPEKKQPKEERIRRFGAVAAPVNAKLDEKKGGIESLESFLDDMLK